MKPDRARFGSQTGIVTGWAMRELTTIPAITLPDWREQHDCEPIKLSNDKDAPFEPDLQTGSDSAMTANGRTKVARDPKLRLRVSGVGFLAALVLCLVATPFVQGLKQGQLCQALLFTLVMCTGLIASGARRRFPLALGSFALAATWLNQLWPRQCPALTFILPAIAFLGVVIASLLGFILRAKRVDANVLCAGISVYLIFGLLWGLAYTLVAQVNPNAFAFSSHPGMAATMSGFTATYFSFTTLMTVGYGDITPVADVARMLAMLEAMTGTLFIGIMIARLVSLYSASGETQPPGLPSKPEQLPVSFQL
jgi:voltage-gated potassium channel Kch